MGQNLWVRILFGYQIAAAFILVLLSVNTIEGIFIILVKIMPVIYSTVVIRPNTF